MDSYSENDNFDTNFKDINEISKFSGEYSILQSKQIKKKKAKVVFKKPNSSLEKMILK